MPEKTNYNTMKISQIRNQTSQFFPVFSIIPCVVAEFPVFFLSGKIDIQIPCFPCAVATLIIRSYINTCINIIIMHVCTHLICTLTPTDVYLHLINYVISQHRDISDVRITRVKHGAECSTDHEMVCSQICLSIKPPCRLNVAKPPQKLNTTKLKYCECADALRSAMETVLGRLIENPPDDITEQWNAFNKTVNNAALNTLEKVKCKPQDWFDESDQIVQDLLQAKATTHIRFISDTLTQLPKNCDFVSAKSTLQRQLRAMKDQS